MKYADAIEKLQSTEIFRINYTLDRIKTILYLFQNPQNDLKYIHVAGTNGKGSVCSIIATILQESNYKIGLYTSPHIFEYTERIKINGIDIKKSEFVKYFQMIEKKCETHSISLTEFEILTVIMFLYFKDNNTDIVVLETGLGGFLDATNIITKNLCSIITHIDFDHTDILGKTKEEIAYQKSGIIKENCPVITSEGYDVIKERADKLNSLMILTSPYVPDILLNSLSLKGLHQKENLALALSCINYLFPEIKEQTIINALSKVKNPFRFEYFKDKNLIIDACHNPNGVTALRNNLDYYFPTKKRRFIFGCLNTKDYETMMKILFRNDDEIYLNEFNYPKALTYKELAKKCPYKTKKYNNSVKLTKDKLNIICGSFYMLQEIIKN